MATKQDYVQSLIDLEDLARKKITGIYDILLRGTTPSEDDIVPNWSDIDVSLVLSDVNGDTLREVNEVYLTLKEKYDFKISITVVSRDDIEGRYHHHGSKPFSYALQLPEATSLFGRSYNFSESYDDRLMLIDLLAHITYLVHDLRKRCMKCGDSTTERVEFCNHLLKRTRHVLRHGIQLYTRVKAPEDVDIELLQEYYPDVDPSLPIKLKDWKRNWDSISGDRSRVDTIIYHTLNGVEKVYQRVLEETGDIIGQKS